MLFVYVTSQFWLIFVEIGEIYNGEGELSFSKNLKWDISQKTPYEITILSVYYSLTALSTVGFGDYYPITSFERLLNVLVFFIGVCTFSYILGQLTNLLAEKNEILEGENVLEKNFENFFVVIQKFNGGFPMNKEAQQEIIDFMTAKEKNDKNLFQTTPHDIMMMQ